MGPGHQLAGGGGISGPLTTLAQLKCVFRQGSLQKERGRVSAGSAVAIRNPKSPKELSALSVLQLLHSFIKPLIYPTDMDWIKQMVNVDNSTDMLILYLFQAPGFFLETLWRMEKQPQGLLEGVED